MSSQAAELTRAIHTHLQDLAAAVENQRGSKEFGRFLDVMSRFPKYSWRNCLLIMMARPEATLVAGFTHWKRLGRSIREGEKAILILAPCPIQRESPKTGDEEERVFFKPACVFDVSQTEGRELPLFEVPEVQGRADELLHRLESVATKRGIQIVYSQLPAEVYGNSQGSCIEIAIGHDTGQQAKTLAHEIAHELLHQGEQSATTEDLTRDVQELEAEAVAYVVCRHFALDAELRSSRYIANWGGDGRRIAASLSRISNTARELIEEVGTRQPVPATASLPLSCEPA